jgi:hypothetical protein
MPLHCSHADIAHGLRVIKGHSRIPQKGQDGILVCAVRV